jgi:N-acetylglucosamine-6-phosphate deacetylase
VIDADDGLIAPGFIDLHVHGGAGADFMDGTAEAFRKALRCHARHGTTRLAATTTVARHEPILEVLNQARACRLSPEPEGARVLGVHFYGPYFRYEARGAHPGGPVRPPVEAEFARYLDFADDLVTATIAPEVDGAEAFALACRAKGVRTNVGHSWATFDQMAEAVGWGVRHVDHLFCAMSDKARLRQFQMYPMRGGVLEATLYFDELTTEVIADGVHLDAGLLKLAWKLKGDGPARARDGRQPRGRHARRRIPARPARRRRAAPQARRRRIDPRRRRPGVERDGDGPHGPNVRGPRRPSRLGGDPHGLADAGAHRRPGSRARQP